VPEGEASLTGGGFPSLAKRSGLMASILGMVREALVPDVVERAGALIGENTTVTRRGLESAVPSVLDGALGQASSPSGAERLFSTITGGRFGTETLSGLGR